MARRYNPQYVKNVIKSSGKITKNIVRTQMPVLSDTVASSADVTREFRRIVTTGKTTFKTGNRLQDTIFKPVKELISNAKEDLRSGKLYNEEREMQAMSGMGGLMDSMFDDDGSNGVDTSAFDKVIQSSTAASMSRQTGNAIAQNASQNTEYLGELSMTQHNQNMMNITKNHLETMKGFNNLQKIGMSLVEFNMKTATDFFDKSLKAQNDQLNELRTIRAALDEQLRLIASLKVNQNANRGLPKNIVESIFNPNGSLNISGFIGNAKNNIKNMVPVNSSMFKQLFDDTKANPIASILTSVIPMFMSKSTKGNMSKLDDSIAGVFGNLMSTLNGWRNGKGDKAWKRTLGTIFGYDTKNVSPNLSAYKNQELNADLELKKSKAITEVIPSYLSEILNSISGIDKSFNYEKGRFVDNADIRKSREDEYNMLAETYGWKSSNSARNKITVFTKDMDSDQKDVLREDLSKVHTWLMLTDDPPGKYSYGDALKNGLMPLRNAEASYNMCIAAYRMIPKSQLNRDRQQFALNMVQSVHVMTMDMESTGDTAAFNGLTESRSLSGLQFRKNPRARVNRRLGSYGKYNNITVESAVNQIRNADINENDMLMNSYEERKKQQQDEEKNNNKIMKTVNKIKQGFSDKIESVFGSKSPFEKAVSSLLNLTERMNEPDFFDRTVGSISATGKNFVDKNVNKKLQELAAIEAARARQRQGRDYVKRKKENKAKGRAEAVRIAKQREAEASRATSEVHEIAKELGVSDDSGSDSGDDQPPSGGSNKEQNKEETLRSNKLNNLFKSYLPKAAIGGVAGGIVGKLLKNHPFIGAVAGAGLNLLFSTSKVQSILFGDPKNEKDKGLFGDLRDNITKSVMEPLKSIMDPFNQKIKEKIVDPFSEWFKGKTDNLKTWLSDKFGFKFSDKKSDDKTFKDTVIEKMDEIKNATKKNTEDNAEESKKVSDTLKEAFTPDPKKNSKFSDMFNNVVNNVKNGAAKGLSAGKGALVSSMLGLGPIPGAIFGSIFSGKKKNKNTNQDKKDAENVDEQLDSIDKDKGSYKKMSVMMASGLSSLLGLGPIPGALFASIINNRRKKKANKKQDNAEGKDLQESMDEQEKETKSGGGFFSKLKFESLGAAASSLLGLGPIPGFLLGRVIGKHKTKKSAKNNDQKDTEDLQNGLEEQQNGGKKGGIRGFFGKRKNEILGAAASSLLGMGPLPGFLLARVYNKKKYKNNKQDNDDQKDINITTSEDGKISIFDKAKNKAKDIIEKTKRAKAEQNLVKKAVGNVIDGKSDENQDLIKNYMNSADTEEELKSAERVTSIAANIQGVNGNLVSGGSGSSEKKSGLLSGLLSTLKSAWPLIAAAIAAMMAVKDNEATVPKLSGIFSTALGLKIGQHLPVSTLGVGSAVGYGVRGITDLMNGNGSDAVADFGKSGANTAKTLIGFKNMGKTVAGSAIKHSSIVFKLTTKIADMLRKLGDNAIVKKLAGEKLSKLLLSKSDDIGKFIGKSIQSSSKVGAKAGLAGSKLVPLLGIAITVAQAVWGFVSGWNDVKNTLKTSSTYDPPIGLRMTSAIVKSIDDSLFGLLDLFSIRDNVIEFIYKIFANKDQEEALDKAQQEQKDNYNKFVAENPGTTISFDKYNKLTNKTTWNKVTDWANTTTLGKIVSSIGLNAIPGIGPVINAIRLFKNRGKSAETLDDYKTDNSVTNIDNSQKTYIVSNGLTGAGARGSVTTALSKVTRQLANKGSSNSEIINLRNNKTKIKDPSLSEFLNELGYTTGSGGRGAMEAKERMTKNRSGRGHKYGRGGTMTDEQRKVVQEALSRVGEKTFRPGDRTAGGPKSGSVKGMCMALDGVIYHAALKKSVSFLNPNTAMKEPEFVEGFNNIPLGALILIHSSEHCGDGINGHTGIYVGNGEMVHAWSDGVRKQSITEVQNMYKSKHGWYAGWFDNQSNLGTDNGTYSGTSTISSNSYTGNRVLLSSVNNASSLIRGIKNTLSKNMYSGKNTMDEVKNSSVEAYEDMSVASKKNPSLMSKLGNSIKGIGRKIKSGASKAAKKVGSIFSTIGGWAKAGINKVKDFFTGSGARGDDPDYYSQYDPRWGNMSFGRYDGHRDTVADGGCGPTVAAMAVQKLTGQKVTPDTMARLAMSSGMKYDNGGTDPAFFNEVGNRYGINFNENIGINNDTLSALKSGRPVVFMGKDTTGTSPFGSGTHYVLGTGLDSDGNVNILDPQNPTNNHKYNINDIAASTMNVMTPSGRGKMTRHYRGKYGRGNNVGSALVATMASLEGKLQYTQDSKLRTQIENGYGDCSSVVQWVYKKVCNVDPGGNTATQKTKGTLIATTSDASTVIANAQPGDLLLFSGHVEMYAGNGECWGHGGGSHGEKLGPTKSTVATKIKIHGSCQIRRYITGNETVNSNIPSISANGGTSNVSLSSGGNAVSNLMSTLSSAFSDNSVTKLFSGISNIWSGGTSNDSGSSGTSTGSTNTVNSVSGSSSNDLGKNLSSLEAYKHNPKSYSTITADQLKQAIKSYTKREPVIAQHIPYIMKAAQTYGIDPRWIVANAAGEGGWDLDNSESINHNNYFGIDGGGSKVKHFDNKEDGWLEGVRWINDSYLNKGQSSFYLMNHPEDAGADPNHIYTPSYRYKDGNGGDKGKIYAALMQLTGGAGGRGSVGFKPSIPDRMINERSSASIINTSSVNMVKSAMSAKKSLVGSSNDSLIRSTSSNSGTTQINQIDTGAIVDALNSIIQLLASIDRSNTDISKKEPTNNSAIIPVGTQQVPQGSYNNNKQSLISAIVSGI